MTAAAGVGGAVQAGSAVRASGSMQTCAHRGDSSRYRENTLPAIRSAIAAGAEFVEIDVRVTSDGAVIVLHDPTLERLWDLPARATDVTLDQVRALGGPDERPPLLSEVLALFAGASSTLLIDMDDAALAEPAYRAVADVLGPDVRASDVPASDAIVRVAWCGDIDGMRTIRRLDPHARIWMPWDRAAAPTAADIGDLAPERINTEFLTMTRELAAEIHALGYAITVWTVDDEHTMRWAQEIGVDTVTTNRLSLLQRVIGTSESDSVGAGDSVGDGCVDTDELREHALVVARGLAQWAIEFSSSADPGQINTKKDAADLVTEVDVAVERHVREVIGMHFADHDFVGEEMGGGARAGVPCWYLDPVDGTANFANRIPWNAFSLALAVDDQPLVAVVADPWRGDLFEAMAGGGARLNGAVLQLPAAEIGDGGANAETAADSDGDSAAAADPLAGRIVSTELANQVPWPGMLELLERLGKRYCTMRVMGSGTMTLVGIAAGRGVGSVIGRFGAVDHVAAALIVHEAGGVVLDSTGEPNLFPAAGGIMAAAPGASAALYALWQESVAANSDVPHR
jgi:myo-inositol-1(or 4)-monophosphatase/deoxyribonuclease-2